jgi:antitoxin HigA-1
MDLSRLDPVHPGEILKEECLDPLNISISEAARKLAVSKSALNRLVNAKSSISIEMAWKLSKAFNTTPQFWLNLQIQYDIASTRNKVDTSNVEVINKAV